MQKFNKNTTNFLDTLMYNVPMVVFYTTIFIRVLTGIVISIVAVKKFMFFGELSAYFLGIASTVALEVLLTALSLVNASFRKEGNIKNMANWLLLLVLLVTAYNSYLIQGIVAFFDVEYRIEALLTLHVLNILSIVLIELLAFVVVKSEPAPAPAPEIKEEKKEGRVEAPIILNTPKFPEEIEKIKHDFTMPKAEKAQKIYDTGYFANQKEIAMYLNISESSITRYITKK